MKTSKKILYIMLMVLAGSLIVACGAEETVDKVEPATVIKAEGDGFNQVILTEKAAQRLGIETDTIREEEMNGSDVMVIPYSAVIYGLEGETWAYTNPESLTYIRAPITIDYIEGDTAVLIDGPEIGTEVVTIGVAELFGTDTGVGK